ncbi:hypothetical protein DACRYDRAFT_29625, partial [Dacryopinax primogenitus]
KKRQKKAQLQEVVFDEEARREYLTGFRKRKMERVKGKVERAKERERVERLRDRAEKRKDIRERALENARRVESALGAVDLPGSETLDDTGAEGGREEEEEYEGEEQFATVTVVEDFDPSVEMHGLVSSTVPKDAVDEEDARPAPKVQPLEKKKTAMAKPKERKFRYETKAARRSAKDKERSRRREKGD